MLVSDFDYDLVNGFAWMTVDSNNDEDIWTVQCCLDAENNTHVKRINAGDCGHNWGLSADCNEKAFVYWGQNRCMTALFKKAKENGFEVIGA